MINTEDSSPLSSPLQSPLPGPSGTAEVGRGGALPSQSHLNGMDDIIVNQTKVKEALSKLSSKSSPGPDGIPANCLKYGGQEMTNFLVSMFRSSVDHSDIPLLLLIALISPAFKAGDRSKAKNYRPISPDQPPLQGI